MRSPSPLSKSMILSLVEPVRPSKAPSLNRKVSAPPPPVASTKPAKLENGVTVNVPEFVASGEKVRVTAGRFTYDSPVSDDSFDLGGQEVANSSMRSEPFGSVMTISYPGPSAFDRTSHCTVSEPRLKK